MPTIKQLIYEEKAKKEELLSNHKQLKEEIANLVSLLKDKRNLLNVIKQQLNACNNRIVLLKSKK